jgi:hypothetical protein
MRIRAWPANRVYLDTINDTLGTALGFKWKNQSVTGEPSIIVFVPQKVHSSWLGNGNAIKSELRIPGELKCPVDVIPARKLGAGPPVSEESPLVRRLRGEDPQLWAGSQICTHDAAGNPWIGSIGCFAKHRESDEIAYVTNHHVAAGPAAYHVLLPGAELIGYPLLQQELIPAGTWYGAAANEPNTYVRVDFAVVLKASAITPARLNPLVIADGRRLSCGCMRNPESARASPSGAGPG